MSKPSVDLETPQSQQYQQEAASIICGKWRLLIIQALAGEAMRFKSLAETLSGISDKMLIQELKALMKFGLIERTSYPEMPPRVDYRLSSKGQLLLPLIDQLRETGEQLNSYPEDKLS